MSPGMKTRNYQDLVLCCMDELIESVNETRRISKGLLNQGLLSEDKYKTIVAAPNSRDRMKQLVLALSSKEEQGRNALYRLLQEHEPELTLQLERALYVHAMRQKLIQSVKHVEPVANRMLTQGLITEEEYFKVCEEEGSEARMRVMYNVLEQHAMKQSDGFYSALFHCEPLLYRQLEKDRVLQMCDREGNQLADNLDERWMELKSREMQVEKEKEDLKREWDLLGKRQAELAQEKKQVRAIKHEFEQIQRKRGKMEDDISFLNNNNNNSYFMPANANLVK